MYTILAILIAFAFGALCGFAFGIPGLLISVPVGMVLGYLGGMKDGGGF